MSLRDTYLQRNYNDPTEAATDLALGLMRDDPASFKVGYTLSNAVLASRDIFPEVPEDVLRYYLAGYGHTGEEAGERI